MTITNGSTSTFSDYDEPRDRLYALEAPVRLVSLPPEMVSEAGFDDCDRRFRE
jgi:hypothetical protein